MKPQMKKRIGARIKELRLQAGYTREQTAELCSRSPRFIANLEDGSSAPSVETVLALCWALSCSADDILFGREERDSSVWWDAINLLRNIDPTYKDQVTAMLRAMVETINKSKQQ